MKRARKPHGARQRVKRKPSRGVWWSPFESITLIPRKTTQGHLVLDVPLVKLGHLGTVGVRLWFCASPEQLVLSGRPTGPNPGQRRTTVRLRRSSRPVRLGLAPSVRALWRRNRDLQSRLDEIARQEQEQ